MNFFETLVRPDKEENDDKAEVIRAANLLQVGEFQVLQLAYKEWFDRELPTALVDRLFKAYMLKDTVPHWARQYARNIIRKDQSGRLNDRDPAFHRYDPAYQTHVPGGVRRFWLATAVILLCLGGGIWVADRITGNGTSVLPPYFEPQDLSGSR